MQDILDDVKRWNGEGKEIAMATVINTWGSSPRPVGAKMALTLDGGISGSVSAGCVEGAVVDEGIKSIKTGRSALVHYGISDDMAFDVGLMCGGKIDILVRPVKRGILDALLDAIKINHPTALATVIQGAESLLGNEKLVVEDGGIFGEIGSGWDVQVESALRQALVDGKSQSVLLSSTQAADEITVFLDVMLTPLTLMVIGGVHIAIPLVTIAKTLGFHTIVIDPRKRFANQERFPHADQIIQSWHEEAFAQAPITSSTAVAVLAHDPKIDDPALIAALKGPAFYVGGLGSKRTQGLRRQRLQEAGLSEEQINRLHGPVGLNIGAKTPEEIALSIMAEIIQVKNER